MDAIPTSISSKVFQHKQITKYYNKKLKERCFNLGDAIYAKNHTQSAPKWIPAVLREQNSNVMISETADGRYLRRHSDHVRRRHTEAIDNPVEQEAVAAPEAGVERPEPGDNEMTRDNT